MNTIQTSSARFEARVKPDIYALLKQAAELDGRSLTDFIIGAAYKAAKEMLQEADIISLSQRDQLRLAEALNQPFKPNAKLQKAFARHQTLVEPR